MTKRVTGAAFNVRAGGFASKSLIGGDCPGLVDMSTMMGMFTARLGIRPAAGLFARRDSWRTVWTGDSFDGDFYGEGCWIEAWAGALPVAVRGCAAMKKAATKKGEAEIPFGVRLRQVRMGQKISLRKFSEMVGISPTYLSQVEQGHFVPPTADRVKKMAEILGEDPDEWIGLADRVPDDLEDRVKQHPKDMPELMRLATGLTPAQFETIKEQIRKMKKREK